MNSPEIAVWFRFFGILALEAFVIVAVAFALQKIVKSSFGRRGLWQSALLGLLLLVTVDVTGFGRGLTLWLTGQPPVERKFSARLFLSGYEFFSRCQQCGQLAQLAWQK